MEEATSWKGHSFTLLVFGGIVVLCGIFFVLGAMVGRLQVARPTAAVESPSGPSAAAAAGAAVAKPERPRIDPKVDLANSAPTEGIEAPRKPVVAEVKPEQKPRPKANARAYFYQVGALRRMPEAEKLAGELKARNFQTVIISPAPDDDPPFFRVQVGPMTDRLELADMKGRLEAAGYRPILKK